MGSLVTILVPLKGRTNFTYRLLAQLNTVKLKFPIFIADGSIYKDFTETRLKNKYKQINIEYKKFKYDKEFKDFINKIIFFLKKIKSKYIFFLPNDDFLNPKFIDNAIEIFKSKKDVTVVSGEVINFNVKNQFFNDNSLGMFKILGSQYKQKNKSIKDDLIFKRVKKYGQLFPWETLIEKKILQKIFNIAKLANCKNYHELNWLYNTLPLIYGKKIKLNTVSILRQNNTITGSGKTLFFNDVDYEKVNKIILNKYIKKELKKLKLSKKNINKIIDEISVSIEKQKKRFKLINKDENITKNIFKDIIYSVQKKQNLKNKDHEIKELISKIIF